MRVAKQTIARLRPETRYAAHFFIEGSDDRWDCITPLGLLSPAVTMTFWR